MLVNGNKIEFDGFKVILCSAIYKNSPTAAEYVAQMAEELADVKSAKSARKALHMMNNDGSWYVRKVVKNV